MSNYLGNKIVWTQGLFLRPQHFQQQERYFERLVSDRLGAARRNNWGFEKLVLDDSELQDKRLLGIKDAKGVFDDGTPFDFKNADLLPNKIRLQSQQVGDQVVLAIPRQNGQVVDVGEEDPEAGKRWARNARHFVDVRDTNVASLGGDKIEKIDLAQLTPRLMLKSSIPEGAYSTLPIARVSQFTPSLELDNHFVPPLIILGADANVIAELSTLRNTIKKRSEQITSLLKEVDGQPLNSFSSLLNTLRLQTLNKNEFFLGHLLHLPQHHPEQVFLELLTFLSELTMFDAVGTRAQLAYDPFHYDHNNLDACLMEVIRAIQEILRVPIETPAMRIEWKRHPDGYYITDPVTNRNKRFYIVVRFDDDRTGKAALKFGDTIRIGSKNTIGVVTNRKTDGFPLRNEGKCPTELETQFGAASGPEPIYFQLTMDKDEASRKDFLASGQLAVLIAPEFENLDIQVWAVGKVGS